MSDQQEYTLTPDEKEYCDHITKLIFKAADVLANDNYDIIVMLRKGFINVINSRDYDKDVRIIAETAIDMCNIRIAKKE